MSAFKHQVGGSHYTSMAIQPAEYCFKNGIGKLEGDAIAYLSRWKMKNGLEDLRKAKHTIELLIELEVNSRNELVKSELSRPPIMPGDQIAVNSGNDWDYVTFGCIERGPINKVPAESVCPELKTTEQHAGVYGIAGNLKQAHEYAKAQKAGYENAVSGRLGGIKETLQGNDLSVQVEDDLRFNEQRIDVIGQNGNDGEHYQPKFGPTLWEKFSADRGDDEEAQV